MIILGIILAYLIGSIPIAVWVGKLFHGIDVRDYGSKNAGATNAFRVLGKKTGFPVLILDILKGFAVIQIAFYTSQYIPGTEHFIRYQLLLGLAAVAGHVFPVFANFRGGKGIATLLGILITIVPDAAVYCLGVFLIVFLSTRFVSLASIIAGISLPVIVVIVFKEQSQSLALFSIFISILILITHQKNIERLLRKQESRIFRYKLRRRSSRVSEESANNELE